MKNTGSITPFAVLMLATLALGSCAQPGAYNSAAADHGGSAQSVTPGLSAGAGGTAQPRTSVSSATPNSAEGADDASVVHNVPPQLTTR